MSASNPLDDPARNALRGIRDIWYKYLRSGKDDAALKALLEELGEKVRELSERNLIPWEKFVEGCQGDKQKLEQRPIFFNRLVPGIAFLVAASATFEEVAILGEVVDKIADVLLKESGFRGHIQKYGQYSHNFGRLNFTAITLLKQSYWSARRNWSEKHDEFSRNKTRHSTHKVIRVNDAPFAEAVHPELMSRYAHELGYSIEVVAGIDWSEVAMALYTNRIDVAFYNGSITKQFRALTKQFDPKLVFSTQDLFRYRGYPILQNKKVKQLKGLSDRQKSRWPKNIQDAVGKIAVPWRSDFDAVVLSHVDEKSKDKYQIIPTTGRDGKSSSRKIRVLGADGVVYVSSVDQALERFINGDLEYCITGGLQAKYASDQFADRVEHCGYLNRKVATRRWASTKTKSRASDKSTSDRDESGVRFWTAVERIHEAEALLFPMIEIWNDHVVGRWPAIVNGVGSEMRRLRNNLVELVNAYDHSAFVDDFKSLNDLISFHDHERRSIKLSIDQWSPES